MKELLLALDIGTSGARAGVFEADGTLVASSGVEYSPYSAPGGISEIDAELWWKGALACLEGLRQKCDLSRVAAIGVDGISWAGLPVDKNGTPLIPAMTWLDRRSTRENKIMDTLLRENGYSDLSGNPADACYITPKMMYVRDRMPDVYRRTACFMQCNSYIVLKLTGVFSQDHSQGYGFHFYDIAERKICEKAAAVLDIDPALLAPFYESYEPVGGLLPSVAELTGLPAGVPVSAGGLDAACCTLGAGVISPLDTQEQGGQAGGMSIDTDTPLKHPKLILGCHVVPGQWLLQGGTTGGGGALRWFRNELGATEVLEGKKSQRSAYEILSEEADTIPPGSNGLCFLPYMQGERSPIWDPNAQGVFAGLSYDKTRAHMVRAVMEGAAFALRHNLETAAEAGCMPSLLRSVGGSATSAVWTQMKADITGIPIRVGYSDSATTLGAAMLAGVGAGIYSSFEDAVRMTQRQGVTYVPDRERHEAYEPYYRQYLDLYPRLADWFRAMP